MRSALSSSKDAASATWTQRTALDAPPTGAQPPGAVEASERVQRVVVGDERDTAARTVHGHGETPGVLGRVIHLDTVEHLLAVEAANDVHLPHTDGDTTLHDVKRLF